MTNFKINPHLFEIQLFKGNKHKKHFLTQRHYETVQIQSGESAADQVY